MKRSVVVAIIVLCMGAHYCLDGMLLFKWNDGVVRNQLNSLFSISNKDLKVPELQQNVDRLFLKYEARMGGLDVDPKKNIVKWGDRFYFIHPHDLEYSHFVYGDITDYYKNLRLVAPIKVEFLQTKITDYVIGYDERVKPNYPVALSENPQKIISLITRQRKDKKGIVDGSYGGPIIDFLLSMAILIRGKSEKEIRPELLDALTLESIQQRPQVFGIPGGQQNSVTRPS